jgi:DNA polymerase III epsilon subunit-like protein
MVVLDLETSSLDENKGSIISIGAIDFENPTNTFYGECHIPENAEYDPKSLEVNGFMIESIHDQSKPSVKDLLKKFLNWLSEIEDQTIAGQNVHWDLAFLKADMRKHALGDIWLGVRIVDLHTVCFTKMLELGIKPFLKNNRTDLNLDNELEFCGISKRPGIHNALDDSKLEAECFSRLIYRKGLLNEYQDFELPDYLNVKG